MELKGIDIAENIFQMVKNLSVEVKLELVNKITRSLKHSRKAPKDDAWKELFGAWKSDESAEDLIKAIRSSRQSNRQIEDL